MEAKEWLNNNELSCNILNKKYINNNECLNDFFYRVSNNNKDVVKLIEEKKFIFGGRILANRNVAGRKLTYSNCYVLEPPEDNLESIFDCASKMARTFSYGGGVGIDLSKLRPNGAVTHNAAKESSGPVSFMDLFSQVTQTISQNGRRGATMISLDIRHPDIEEFINCKTDLERVKYANISVRINDEFMKAVENDEDYILQWPCDTCETWKHPEKYDYNVLVKQEDLLTPNCIAYFKKVKAKDIFEKLVKNNWNYAEPGILYWDRISNYNLLDNDDNFEYAGTNPCAEEPLPAGGSCLLGSINLSELVTNPFTKDAKIDWNALEYVVRTAVKALNEVLIEGQKLHPLDIQKKSVHHWRQIGLGTMGLADCLIKLGIRYGSEESIDAINKLYRIIAIDAITESLELAKEFGAYPGCEKELLVESNFIKNLDLPESVLENIKTYGLFNSQLLTCAPTGSIGTMLETSTGVEPNFALKYMRKTLSLDNKESYYEVNAKIVDDYRKLYPEGDLPNYFVTSADITPEERVAVQGALQRWIDASISSTVNLPKEATVEDVYTIYMNAWKNGLKGITVYRSGCKREAILSTGPKEDEITTTRAPKRPKELDADLHMVKVKGEQFIVLIGLLNGRPYETFAFRPNMDISIPNHKGKIIKKSKMHYTFESDILKITELELANANIEEKATTMYASMLLRHGVDIKYIIKTAKKVNSNIASFTSALCRVLSKYTQSEVMDEKCPECGNNVIRESGCVHCVSCGWSRCE